MAKTDPRYDLCVIGAGSGGLSVAAGAAQMGAKVCLIERDRMGGECLNTGCVPSKALLAAGHRTQAAQRLLRFGVQVGDVQVDGADVFNHVHDVIDTIAPHDSVERFEGLGVDVIEGAAAFVTRDTVAVGKQTVSAKRFVVATGSRPAVPRVPGLDQLDPLTNETVFDLAEIPDHLIVIGGGPIGCELAQAFRHLGAEVTILEMAHILPKDDTQLAGVVHNRLLEDGVTIHEGVEVLSADGTPDAPDLTVKGAGGQTHTIKGSHILVAAGRKPNVEDLGLDVAGVDFTPQGIVVDRRLRTTNPRIFALGDVTGGLQFTHVAGYQAGIVIRNVLFKWPVKVNDATVPWVTYTDPELAQVGLSEAQARERFGDGVRVLTSLFKDNDRACAEGEREGMIKVVVGTRGRILGAGIAGPRAGELIQPWVLAMEQGLKIGAMASTIAPYPTLGEISKRAAGDYFTPKLFSPWMRFVVRFIQKYLS